MSISIPYYFEAKQISTMGATPLTPGAGGILTAGTGLDLVTLGVYDRFTCEATQNPFEYSPANAGYENYQPGKKSFTATLAQIDQRGKASALTDIYNAYSYLRVAAQAEDPFTSTLGKWFVIVAFISNIGTGWVEGRNATTLELRPCGIPIQWNDNPTI